ncbi:hypothetical protein ASF72_18490 [Arthrobacter sp. Leaf141]|uniref:DUF4862 family protein n=1 Tax=Arthrobacter sp. Leaf141 TaxID=1736273 RepID=UPI0006F42265|nr:DUF4862 family protein [Arthrobacter sp. Leaf141]KQQ98431.1 hypothetical protein ASF72_18490 [Arthrobacter sp. Leaf141]
MIVSSYAAAPALDGWDPEQEAAFLAAAASLPHVSGLEIPLYATGELHKYDGDWFLKQLRYLPDHLTYVVTTIPDTMDRLARSSDFGLASTTEAGRQAAIGRAAVAAEAVRTLNDALDRRAVRAVHLFSAPRLGAGVPGASPGVKELTESLRQAAGFRWDGARIVLEHCDAAGPSHAPVKGFLRFEQEVEAVLAAGTGAGIAVNWARSTIEDRDPGAPVRHVELASAEGILAGVVLSGCSSQATDFGAAWDDSHLPPAPVEPASVLTPQRIRTLAAAVDAGLNVTGPEPYRGLKISAPQGSSMSERVALLEESIDAVRRAGFCR